MWNSAFCSSPAMFPYALSLFQFLPYNPALPKLISMSGSFCRSRCTRRFGGLGILWGWFDGRENLWCVGWCRFLCWWHCWRFVGVGASSGTTKSVEKTNIALPYSSINWYALMTACVVVGSLLPKQNKYLGFCSKTVQAYSHLDQRVSTSAKNSLSNSSDVKILIKV